MRRWGALRAGECLLLLVVLANAEPLEPVPDYQGQVISSIAFLPARQPLTRASLARRVQLHVGQPLRIADVRSTIKQLYRSGEYASVEVDASPATGGMAVLIRTTEQYFVGGVEVRGKQREPPNRGQIANASRLELGEPFSEQDLETAVTSIRTLLRRNGLYLASIVPKVEPDSEHQELTFTFVVDTGSRARFTEPKIIGDTRLPVAELAKAAKYKSILLWKQATRANTQNGVENVRKKYVKENRLTATVSLDHTDYLAAENRVRPTIRADGGPKVTIGTSGAKVSQSKLQNYVPVFDEGSVNRDLLVAGLTNLRDYFQTQGYFNVRVDFNTRQDGPDHEAIQYVIGLGERYRVVSVQVRGNHYFLTKDIRERMFIQPKGLLILRHGRYSDGFAMRDEAAITDLYQANGFLDATADITTAPAPLAKPGDVVVLVTIKEGPQYRVSTVTLEGVQSLDKSRMTAKLASAPGQPYSESNVGMDRTFILNEYHDGAYPDAGFDWRMSPGPGPHEVALQYFITEGQPRFVRDVIVTGLHHTRSRILARSMLLKPGDALSWSQMGRIQRRLYNLGVFDTVDMAIQNPDGDTENKDVLYHLTEAHRYDLNFGFGAEVARFGGSATSLDNPAGTTGIAPRVDLDLTRNDMFGLGHSLNFKGRYSTLDTLTSLDYSIPHYHDVEGRNITVTGLYENIRDVLTFTARRVEGSVQLSQQISKGTTALFRYTWRDVQVDQSTLKINPLLIPLTSQPARLGIVATSLIRDHRDNPVNAHRGTYNSLDVELVDHDFGGNRNFFRMLAQNSFYKRIHGDTIVASNTQFGWIAPFGVPSGISPSDYVPLPEKFFGGGSNSDRGFPEDQAGPRDPLTGFPLGGNAVLFHSTELRFPLIGANIGGVIFHDMGNVYSSLSAISFRFHQNSLTDFDYMVHAVGFGIRYRTPLGPVRIDLAYSLNPPTFNGLQGNYQQLILNTATPAIQSVSHFQFFFSIGQAF